jgi:type IV pilus assembly protein PilM
MAEEVVTLFIDDTDIRLVTFRGKHVKKWAYSPLEPGLVADGVILEEEVVANQVRELFEQQGITRRVIAGLSGFNCLYRVITLPELPRAILDEAVRREAERVVPMSLDQVHLSYQSIPALKGETRLFLVASPRTTVDALLRTLRQAGLEPYLMDLAPLALCRTVDEPRAIILDARPTNFEIIILADRIPQVIRSLPLSQEAESLSEKLPLIREELDRTVNFYNSSHLEKPIDSTVPLLVCGDLAEAPEVWQTLAGRWNCPVSVLPWSASPEGFIPSQFMVNIGLANKELMAQAGGNFSVVNLNALPGLYIPKRRPLSQYLIPAGIAVGTALVISAASFAYGSVGHTTDLRSELAAADGLITETRMGINEGKEEVVVLGEKVVQLEGQVKEVEQQIEQAEANASLFTTTFGNLGRQRSQVDADFKEIVRALPGSIELLTVNHYDFITVTGVTHEEKDIFLYARALRPRFPAVNVSIQKLEELQGYEFTLSLE